eukprot:Gb_01364 [translate_table: standard]
MKRPNNCQRRKKVDVEDTPSSKKGQKVDKNAKRPSSQKAKNVDKEDLSEKIVEPETINLPGSNFHDFDKDRIEEFFEVDQIWAVYDDDDGMPRFYARILKVPSLKGFKGCGDFKSAKVISNDVLNIFSHSIARERGPKGVVRILPIKGDVWALHRQWSSTWDELTPLKDRHKYEMVEIENDFIQKIEVDVIPLVKADGFKSVFQKKTRAINTSLQANGAACMRWPSACVRDEDLLEHRHCKRRRCDGHHGVHSRKNTSIELGKWALYKWSSVGSRIQNNKENKRLMAAREGEMPLFRIEPSLRTFLTMILEFLLLIFTNYSHARPYSSLMDRLSLSLRNGEVITWSLDRHEEIFYGELGGLGQFGIVTKAIISICHHEKPLIPPPSVDDVLFYFYQSSIWCGYPNEFVIH